jgi:signal transduction histidine kinase
MRLLTAIDALSDRVLRVQAETRVNDILSEVQAAHATHAAVHDGSRYCGLLRLQDILLRSPERIFADLLPKRPQPTVPPDLPVEEVGRLLATNGCEALAVVDANGELLGAVTQPSVLQALLHERYQTEARIRRLESHLETASRLGIMGEVAAGVAHELHQPLAVIANYAQGSLRRLETGNLDKPQVVELMQTIASETLRAGDIIRRIRRFIRNREPNRQSADFRAALNDALQLANLSIGEHRIEVGLDVADVPSPILADGIQLTQLLLILIRNAIAALQDNPPGNRRLTIAARPADAGWIEVAVSDTGHGIPDDIRERIFDHFFTTRPEGLGMGLATARTLVEAHQGRLWVESQPGAGSCFRFTLPIGG